MSTKKTHKKQKICFCAFFFAVACLELLRQELFAGGEVVCGVDEPL